MKEKWFCKMMRHIFIAIIVSFFSFGLICCHPLVSTFRPWNGTYYVYYTDPPFVTTDENYAAEHFWYERKELQDNVYYYCTEEKRKITKDSSEAKFVISVGTFKHGHPIGRHVWFDGYGDTMRINDYNTKSQRVLHCTFYGDNHIMYHIEYKDDKPHGIEKHYYPNGSIKSSTTWENGWQNGEYLKYYPNTKLWQKGVFDYGLQDGIWSFLSEQGDTLKTERWEKGRFIDSVSYQNR